MKNIAEIYERQAAAVYRVAYMFVKNKADAEDMTHNAFVKLMGLEMTFESPEHEKAFLIRVTQSVCKDFLKSAWRKHRSSDEAEAKEAPAPCRRSSALEEVLALPEKYKIPIYLFYYEGYKTAEIAKILGKPESTVRGLLHRGRKILKLELEGENYVEARINGGV